MRLIDADALKEALNANCDDLCPDKNTNWCLHCCPHNEFEDLIDNAPTVCNDNYSQGYQDGVKKVLSERPHGEWIEDSGNIACSHCHTIWLYRRTDFCPNCGAEMKGD